MATEGENKKSKSSRIFLPKIRINEIWLAPLERPVLLWMAKRIPPWIYPDHLTILAVMSALLIFVSYLLTQISLDWLWLANLGLFLHWLGDSLDGTLARVRHIEREQYGLFIDHNSDTISIFLICLGVGLSPLMDLRIALFLIISYYALCILTYLVSISRGIFKISFAGIGPTEIRLVVILYNISVWYFKNPEITIVNIKLTLFSWFGLMTLISFSLGYIICSEIERRKLARIDPPKKGTFPKVPP